MTHEELEALLVDYLYDELDEETRSRFDEALPGAPDLLAEVEAHRRTREAMSSLEDVPVPQGLLDGVLAEAERRADLRTESEPGFMARILAGLMQPAALTLGLFFVMAGTGYYMVVEKGLQAPDDASLAVGAPVDEPASKAVPSEAAAPPELDEAQPEESEPDEAQPEESEPEESKIVKPTDESAAALEGGRPGGAKVQGDLVVMGAKDKGRDAAAIVPLGGDAPTDLVSRSTRRKGGGKSAAQGPKTRTANLAKKRARPARQVAVAPGTIARLVTVDEKKAELADQAPAAGAEQLRSAAQPATSGAVAHQAAAPRPKPALTQGTREQKQVYQARPREEQEGRNRRSLNVPRGNSSGYATRVAPASPPASQPAAPAADKEYGSEADADDARTDRSSGERAEEKTKTKTKAKTETRKADSAADDKASSPWKDTEDEASRQKSARGQAGVWLRAYDRFKKSGRRDLARRALDRLAKVPGYAGVAKDKRRALAKTDAGGGPKKVPAAAERSFSREAPAKAKSKATKKK
jgi:anti-sigma factor RsiW